MTNLAKNRDCLRLLLFALGIHVSMACPAAEPTREFEIKDDRAYLGGKQVDLWGLRCGNALFSESVTERHIRNLDNMTAHGINLIGVYIQGSNAGWPNADGNLNGFTRDGKLKPVVAKRLESLIRAADERGMVVMVGLFTPAQRPRLLRRRRCAKCNRECRQIFT